MGQQARSLPSSEAKGRSAVADSDTYFGGVLGVSINKIILSISLSVNGEGWGEVQAVFPLSVGACP